MSKSAKSQMPEPLGSRPMTWETAAKVLGENMASCGPNGYGDFTPEQWLEWAQSMIPVSSSARPDRQTVEQARAHYEEVLDTYLAASGVLAIGKATVALDAAINDLIAAAVRQEQADARPARTLKDYVQHDDGCRKGKPTTNCPQCQGQLERVKQSANSMLNSCQFDAVKAGDFFCRTCLGGESQATTFKYWWERELVSQPCTCGLDALLSGETKGKV